MNKYQQAKALSELALGKKTQYQEHYSPSLLQAVPRSLNRNALNLSDTLPFNTLPFNGYDIWTLYEMSWLNNKGLPQVAIGEVRVPALSPNMVESKSFKLYLNSFNQTKFDSWQQVTDILSKDIATCAGEKVDVTLQPLKAFAKVPIASLGGISIDDQDIEINNYELNPSLLENAAAGNIVTETLCSDLLKSNCLITNQPDWASISISYTGKGINREKLLRYIVSFRRHNEFHEQCVERIFCDIMHYCKPELLTVYARYTRRGGIDINPYRSTPIILNQEYQEVRLARQ